MRFSLLSFAIMPRAVFVSSCERRVAGPLLRCAVRAAAAKSAPQALRSGLACVPNLQRQRQRQFSVSVARVVVDVWTVDTVDCDCGCQLQKLTLGPRSFPCAPSQAAQRAGEATTVRAAAAAAAVHAAAAGDGAGLADVFSAESGGVFRELQGAAAGRPGVWNGWACGNRFPSVEGELLLAHRPCPPLPPSLYTPPSVEPPAPEAQPVSAIAPFRGASPKSHGRAASRETQNQPIRRLLPPRSVAASPAVVTHCVSQLASQPTLLSHADQLATWRSQPASAMGHGSSQKTLPAENSAAKVPYPPPRSSGPSMSSSSSPRPGDQGRGRWADREGGGLEGRTRGTRARLDLVGPGGGPVGSGWARMPSASVFHVHTSTSTRGKALLVVKQNMRACTGGAGSTHAARTGQLVVSVAQRRGQVVQGTLTDTHAHARAHGLESAQARTRVTHTLTRPHVGTPTPTPTPRGGAHRVHGAVPARQRAHAGRPQRLHRGAQLRGARPRGLGAQAPRVL
jgi:hypothetical protein